MILLIKYSLNKGKN